MTETYDSEPIIEISPEIENFPYLPTAGTYGTGCQHDVDVELTKFEHIAKGTPEAGPGFDRDCKRSGYMMFAFQVTHPEQGLVNVREYQSTGLSSGSKGLTWLRALGVPMDETVGADGKPRVQFNAGQVAPRKCAITVGDPRQSKDDPDKWYTGRISKVEGLG